MAIIQNHIQVGEYCHAHRHDTEVRFNLSCVYQLPPSAVVGRVKPRVFAGVCEVPEDVAGGVAWIPLDRRIGLKGSAQ